MQNYQLLQVQQQIQELQKSNEYLLMQNKQYNFSFDQLRDLNLQNQLALQDFKNEIMSRFEDSQRVNNNLLEVQIQAFLRQAYSKDFSDQQARDLLRTSLKDQLNLAITEVLAKQKLQQQNNLDVSVMQPLKLIYENQQILAAKVQSLERQFNSAKQGDDKLVIQELLDNHESATSLHLDRMQTSDILQKLEKLSAQVQSFNLSVNQLSKKIPQIETQVRDLTSNFNLLFEKIFRQIEQLSKQAYQSAQFQQNILINYDRELRQQLVRILDSQTSRQTKLIHEFADIDNVKLELERVKQNLNQQGKQHLNQLQVQMRTVTDSIAQVKSKQEILEMSQNAQSYFNNKSDMNASLNRSQVPDIIEIQAINPINQ